MLAETSSSLLLFASGGLPADTHNMKFLGHESRCIESEQGRESKLQGVVLGLRKCKRAAPLNMITFLARSPVAPSTTMERTLPDRSCAMPTVFLLPLGVVTSTRDIESADGRDQLGLILTACVMIEHVS